MLLTFVVIHSPFRLLGVFGAGAAIASLKRCSFNAEPARQTAMSDVTTLREPGLRSVEWYWISGCRMLEEVE